MRRYMTGKLAKVVRVKQPSLTFLRDNNDNIITEPTLIQRKACDTLQEFGGDANFNVRMPL